MCGGWQAFASEYAVYRLILRPGALPGAAALAWANSWMYAIELAKASTMRVRGIPFFYGCCTAFRPGAGRDPGPHLDDRDGVDGTNQHGIVRRHGGYRIVSGDVILQAIDTIRPSVAVLTTTPHMVGGACGPAVGPYKWLYQRTVLRLSHGTRPTGRR